MKFVVDSNRVIASLLKDSTTREILFNRSFKFIAPEFIKEEIIKYKPVFINKGMITDEAFDILLSLIFERITLIPKKDYSRYLKSLEEEILDPKDMPYLACCISAKADGIWTHDPHFEKQKKAKVLTNIDMSEIAKAHTLVLQFKASQRFPLK